jgi:mannose-1-phosphate guanylyltransferase
MLLQHSLASYEQW